MVIKYFDLFSLKVFNQIVSSSMLSVLKTYTVTFQMQEHFHTKLYVKKIEQFALEIFT